MDVEKLCDKLIEDDDLKDIPHVYIYRIVLSLFSLIESGEFFYYKEGFD